jgi:hypothetical protein
MICNDGDEAIFFDVVDNAPWITPVEPIDRIVMPGECVEVSINYFGPTRDSGRLPDGTYTKAVVGVKATNATNSPIKIPVTLTVHLPILELNPERPDFIRIDAREGGPVVIGELFAYNPGSGTFDFIIGDNAFWLEVLPSSPGNDRILSHDETESIRFQCNPGSLAARASPYGPATIVVKPRGAKAKRVDVLMYIMP